jgi:hypothetical protein
VIVLGKGINGIILFRMNSGHMIDLVLTFLGTDGFVKLCDVGIEIGMIKSLDELCMDDFICDFVLYCFASGISLLGTK